MPELIPSRSRRQRVVTYRPISLDGLGSYYKRVRYGPALIGVCYVEYTEGSSSRIGCNVGAVSAHGGEDDYGRDARTGLAEDDCRHDGLTRYADPWLGGSLYDRHPRLWPCNCIPE